METFFLAIMNDWHVFAQTKLCTIFRNVFILYHKKSDSSLKALSEQYGLCRISTNAFLYNDLEYAKAGTKVVYLHKCNIYKKQFDIFIEGLEDKEYTYEDAYNKLQELYDIHSVEPVVEPVVEPASDRIFKENKREGNFESDPDNCVIYHSDKLKNR